MAMSSVIAQEYIEAFRHTETIRRNYQHLIDNPICGKPHMGYKARKIWRKKLAAFMPEYEAQRQTIITWLTRNNKASRDERQQRLQRVQAVIPTFTLD